MNFEVLIEVNGDIFYLGEVKKEIYHISEEDINGRKFDVQFNLNELTNLSILREINSNNDYVLYFVADDNVNKAEKSKLKASNGLILQMNPFKVTTEEEKKKIQSILNQ